MVAVSHLKALQALDLALRTGSLRAAAGSLGVSPAAVGQRIKALEDYLGLDLIVRGRAGIRPTREAQLAMAHLGAAFEELRAACEILDYQRVAEIHIVADSDLAELWLAPRLGSFMRANPNARFCINGIGDARLRLGRPDGEIWLGEPRGRTGESPLFRDYLLPVSSRANTERISQLPYAGRLEGFPLLHLEHCAEETGAIGWPEWIGRFGHRKMAADRGIRYRKVARALEAVRSDAGLLVCGLALVLADLERGNVTLPFAAAEGCWAGHSYRVAFSPAAMRRVAVVRFREWLLREGRATAARLDVLTAPA